MATKNTKQREAGSTVQHAGYVLVGLGAVMLIAAGFMLLSQRASTGQSGLNATVILSRELNASRAANLNTLNELNQTRESLASANQRYDSMISNLSSPDVVVLENDTNVRVAGYNTSYAFSNNACSLFGGYFCDSGYENPILYNNYTVGSYDNLTFSFPNDGYLILKVSAVFDANNQDIAPVAGTFTVGAYPSATDEYYATGTRIPTDTLCQNATTGGYSACPVQKATTTGFGLYPLNASATYLIPVSRGNEILSLGNFNQYPITMVFNLTYVGIRYSNLTRISENYT